MKFIKNLERKFNKLNNRGKDVLFTILIFAVSIIGVIVICAKASLEDQTKLSDELTTTSVTNWDSYRPNLTFVTDYGTTSDGSINGSYIIYEDTGVVYIRIRNNNGSTSIVPALNADGTIVTRRQLRGGDNE